MAKDVVETARFEDPTEYPATPPRGVPAWDTQNDLGMDIANDLAQQAAQAAPEVLSDGAVGPYREHGRHGVEGGI